MKVIILAAGEGVRMRPLTNTFPKPLLRYQGKANLDHLFDRLPPEISEAIISIGYLAEEIKRYCGDTFHGRSVRYVPGSSAGNVVGVLNTRPFLKGGERFAVAYGDEVFVGDELTRAVIPEFSWLCYETSRPKEVGIAELDDMGRIIRVLEKPEHPPSCLAADGFMVLNTDIFSYPLVRHPSGEQYFSDLMNQFVRAHDVRAVSASPGHTQLTDPADIERLNKIEYSKSR